MYRPSIDPVALLAIAALTAVVAVVAAFVPGRRAARMDPVVACATSDDTEKSFVHLDASASS